MLSFFGFPGTVLLIQEGNQIGGNEFWPLSIGIENFEHELGFVYDLSVAKVRIENHSADGSGIEYELLQVISKTEVSADTEFKIRLTLNRLDGEFISWIAVDGSNYSIANSPIALNCGALCTTLSEKIINKEQLTGVFTHGEGDVYVLQELLNE